MLKHCWVLLMGLPMAVSAGDKDDAALMKCYKAHETHVEVTACLDNYWRIAQSDLESALVSLESHFVALDAISSAADAAPSVKHANEAFQAWREQQCKMVEASFASGSGSGQGYLACMIELTQEQIGRLNDLMGKQGDAQ